MKLEGYSNYEIYPETGKIYSYTSNRYIGAKQNNGYYKCNLVNDKGDKLQTNIHRVIWTVVNGEIPEGMQVNHINEDKSDNRICNLNLMTAKENTNWGSGIKRSHIKRNKPVIALQNGIVKMWFPSETEAQKNGFSQTIISRCCNDKRKTHKNHQWEYQDNFLADWWEQEMEKGA